MNKECTVSPVLLKEIKSVIREARSHIRRSVDTTIVQAYWHIGRLIVEEEQKGSKRAEYGKQQLEHISLELINEFGKGFDVSNLRRMRKFYTLYPIQGAVCPELDWSHYRILISIDNESARKWYEKEAHDNNWSSRALNRQVNKLYYERLLSSQDKLPIIQEAKENTEALALKSKDFLRDPYILDFLNLSHDKSWLESNLESALIENLQDFLLELGKGFAFVARQKRITTKDQDFYIDLVFYVTVPRSTS